MKKLLIVLLILAVPFVLMAGGKQEEKGGAEEAGASAESAPAKKAEITMFYYKDTVVDGMNSLAEAFMEKYPNITVKNEMLTTEFNTVLKSKDAAGKLPECWAAQPGERAMKAYINAGKVQPVGGFAVIDNLSDNFKKSITFSDGKVWVVPMLTTARGIIYNTEMFKAVGYSTFPNTLDKLEDACEKLEAKGIIPFASGAKDGWTVGSLVYQCGVEALATPDFGERMWAGEASHQEIKDIFGFIDLFKEYSQNKAMETDFMGSVSLYAQEKAAMIVQGPWAADAMMDLAPEVVEVSKMAGIPYTNNPAKNGLYMDYDLYWAVSADADAEAVDMYFDYMINGEGRKIFSEEITSINPYGIPFNTHPVNESILNAENVMGDVQYVGSPDGWWQNQAIVMQEYLLGDITQNEMLEKLDKDWAAAANQ
jgi:raffinose/stachyose/melibiose transport system substrate-binding protein